MTRPYNPLTDSVESLFPGQSPGGLPEATQSPGTGSVAPPVPMAQPQPQAPPGPLMGPFGAPGGTGAPGMGQPPINPQRDAMMRELALKLGKQWPG